MSAPPGPLPSLPWALRGGTAIRCAVAAAFTAAPFTVIAVEAGRNAAYSAWAFTIGAAVGAGSGLWLSWAKRRLLSPRPPEGVSRWRVRQLTAAVLVPTDPAERAALTRALQAFEDPKARVMRTCMRMFLVLVFVSSVVYFAAQSMTVWVLFACVAYPLGLLLTWVEERRATVTRRYLLAQLD